MLVRMGTRREARLGLETTGSSYTTYTYTVFGWNEEAYWKAKMFEYLRTSRLR